MQSASHLSAHALKAMMPSAVGLELAPPSRTVPPFAASRDDPMEIEVPLQGFVAFAGAVRIAVGDLAEAAAAARRAQDEDPNAAIVIFNRETAELRHE